MLAFVSILLKYFLVNSPFRLKNVFSHLSELKKRKIAINQFYFNSFFDNSTVCTSLLEKISNIVYTLSRLFPWSYKDSISLNKN